MSFTIYDALHSKSDVDRLYIPRTEEGKSLTSIKDCAELAVTWSVFEAD